MAVAMVCENKFSSNFPSMMCLAKLTDPKLQTAVSSFEVLRVISVQRLEQLTTPT